MLESMLPRLLVELLVELQPCSLRLLSRLSLHASVVHALLGLLCRVQLVEHIFRGEHCNGVLPNDSTSADRRARSTPFTRCDVVTRE